MGFGDWYSEKGKTNFLRAGMDNGGNMVKLFSIKEMRLLEQEANKCGLSYDDMMENAGVGIANEIISAYSHFTNKKIISLVGSGNNGGDALVALAHLSENGWETYAYIVRSRELNDPLLARLSKLNCGIINLQDDNNFNQLDAMLDKCSVVIDGIFGTGIKLPLQNESARVLQAVKEKLQQMTRKVYVVAVDCPSGIDCDTGEVAAETIPADITVTMAGFKLGLIKSPALNYTGIIRVASIGNIGNFDHYRQNEKYVVTDDFVRINLPKRALDAHKGTFGTAFIIAGSVSYTGAALLAGKAAYLSGVGLVTTAIPEPLHSAISGQFPESTWVVLPHENGVISVDAVPVIYAGADEEFVA
jgi:NAD(P)H-hydrate epimerase